jgi:hypothetical protein
VGHGWSFDCGRRHDEYGSDYVHNDFELEWIGSVIERRITDQRFGMGEFDGRRRWLEDADNIRLDDFSGDGGNNESGERYFSHEETRHRSKPGSIHGGPADGRQLALVQQHRSTNSDKVRNSDGI